MTLTLAVKQRSRAPEDQMHCCHTSCAHSPDLIVLHNQMLNTLKRLENEEMIRNAEVSLHETFCTDNFVNNESIETTKVVVIVP